MKALDRTASEVDELFWTHAAQPQKGGFGLRDPHTIVDIARLASLANVAERALSFGALQELRRR